MIILRTHQTPCQTSNTQQNTDGHNNGNDNSVWKADGCTVAYYPPLAGGEAKSLSNTVPQKYAQQLLDKCGASGEGGSAVGVSTDRNASASNYIVGLRTIVFSDNMDVANSGVWGSIGHSHLRHGTPVGLRLRAFHRPGGCLRLPEVRRLHHGIRDWYLSPSYLAGCTNALRVEASRGMAAEWDHCGIYQFLYTFF